MPNLVCLLSEYTNSLIIRKATAKLSTPIITVTNQYENSPLGPILEFMVILSQTTANTIIPPTTMVKLASGKFST